MLLGVDPTLGADLLHALAAMGHGDRVVLIDAFIADPCTVTQVVGEPGALPPVVAEMNAALGKRGGKAAVSLERNAFYAAAETAYAIVQTGERRFYGNILLTKGVIAPEEQS